MEIWNRDKTPFQNEPVKRLFSTSNEITYESMKHTKSNSTVIRFIQKCFFFTKTDNILLLKFTRTNKVSKAVAYLGILASGTRCRKVRC